MLNGIDISHWNGNINWEKLSGIDFVIIKAGGSDGGFYKDNFFENNYAMAKRKGLKVGAYYYVGSGFLSTNDGIEDAKRFLKICEGKEFDFGMWLDMESTKKSDRVRATTASIAFMEYLKASGKITGIYSSDISGFKEMLELDRLQGYNKWVARYGKNPAYVKDYKIWQYSSGGSVSGISGNVDMNYACEDISKQMKKKETAVKQLNYDEAVKMLVDYGVIHSRGYWDNAIKCVKYVDDLIINCAIALDKAVKERDDIRLP